MEPRIIKTEKQYRAYLEEVARLAAEDPAPGSADGDRLELLAKLVEDYEKERFRFDRPDPAGWFSAEEIETLTPGDIVRRYLAPQRGPLYLRHTITYGATPATNKTNLRLWVGRVRELARVSHRQRGAWRAGTLDDQFLAYVAKLSWAETGPRLAQAFLAEKGIALIILPALPQTRLDGAAMLGQDGAPIIGLTVRHDRLDAFWFTLLHELAHAWKHLEEPSLVITDEEVEDERDDDPKEAEANRIARETFISRALWKRSEAFLRPSPETIQALADKLHISPAVVAGRLRREKAGYAAFSRLVGNRQVRRLFPEVKWG